MPQITTSTSGKKVFERNAFRRSLVFHNKGTGTIFLETMEPNGISTTNAGIRIPEGGIISMDWLKDGAETITNAWSVIAESGTPLLVYREQNGIGLPTIDLERKANGANQ